MANEETEKFRKEVREALARMEKQIADFIQEHKGKPREKDDED